MQDARKTKGKYKGSIFVMEIPLTPSPEQYPVLDDALGTTWRFQNALIRNLQDANRRMRESKEFHAWKVQKNLAKKMKALKLPDLEEQNKKNSEAWKRMEERFSLYQPEHPKEVAEGKKPRSPYRLNDKLSICNFGITSLRKVPQFSGKLSAEAAGAIAREIANQWNTNRWVNHARTNFKKRRDVRVILDTGTGEVISCDPKALTVSFRWMRNGESVVHVLKISESSLDDKMLHALSLPIRNCKLVREEIRGEDRWSVHITVEGIPLLNFVPAKDGLAGLDLGTQGIAIAADSGIRKQSPKDDEDFVKKLEALGAQERRMQRHLDRMDRAKNPDAYDEKGRSIKGKRREHSKECKKVRKSLNELERVVAAFRDIKNSETANGIMEGARTIKAEACSVEGWKALFGKSISDYAPGSIINKLEYKAKMVGAEMLRINTYQTCLSQYCVCGYHFPKEDCTLDKRTKVCPICGRTCDRDDLSAYLARYVEVKTRLDKDGKEEKYQVTNFQMALEDLSSSAAAGLVRKPRENPGELVAVAQPVAVGTGLLDKAPRSEDGLEGGKSPVGYGGDESLQTLPNGVLDRVEQARDGCNLKRGLGIVPDPILIPFEGKSHETQVSSNAGVARSSSFVGPRLQQADPGGRPEHHPGRSLHRLRRLCGQEQGPSSQGRWAGDPGRDGSLGIFAGKPGRGDDGAERDRSG